MGAHDHGEPLADERGKRHSPELAVQAARPGPALLSGSIQLTAHAYALLDSYIYGFALQEEALPFEGRDTTAEITNPIMERFATGEYPRMVEIAVEHVLKPGYDFGDEFRVRPGPGPGRPRPPESRRRISAFGVEARVSLEALRPTRYGQA
ncbi:hypothetical protein [Paenarthrobacter nitroguajacolicus]|uniref:hypothetical protein n=1 Tax=Paenarthrobacter nitroguajacolicus TaxID=211146 RepID=UPI003AF3B931